MSSSHPYIIQDPVWFGLYFVATLVFIWRLIVVTMLLPEPNEFEIDGSTSSDGPAAIEEDKDTENPKGKGRAVVVPIENASAQPFQARLAELEAELEDTAGFWHKYKPPHALRNVDGVESDILLRMIPQSIDRVVARALENEEKQKSAVEAAEKETQELTPPEEGAVSETNGKDQDSETTQIGNDDGGSSPAVKPPPPKVSRPEYSSPSTVDFAGTTFTVDQNGFLQLTPSANTKKPSIRARLFRRPNSNSSSQVKAESSTAAAARNDMSSFSWASELEKLAPRRRPIVLDKLKKVAGGSNSSNPGSASNAEKQIECISCFDDFPTKELVKGPCHSYCHDCFSRLISTACQNETQWPPKCCLNTMPKKTVLKNIDSALEKTYRERAEEWGTPVSDRIYCSHAECSLWLRPRQIDSSISVATCTSGHKTCAICRGPDHQGSTCPRDVDLLRTEELAEEEGWRRCHGCHAYVEHREACQHMTCRCGAEFCYVCGARWRTCACTMEQLASVKRRAEQRRQTRRAREEVEDAEVAEAIRLVAEFEREEARKAELLRQERELREQRELERRIEMELARRRDVELNFQALRETLVTVHERQMLAVTAELDEERRSLETSSRAASSTMEERHRVLRESIMANTDAMIKEHRSSLDQEYAARAREELHLESEYLRKLVDYYRGKADGDQKVTAAMDDLGRKMDSSFRTWQKWMHNELETFSFQAKEEQAVQLELLEHAERQLAGKAATDQAALERKVLAQLKWLTVVISERNSMLTDAEADELGNSSDFDALFSEHHLDLELGVPDP